MGITTFGNRKNTRLRLVSFTLSESLAASRVHGSLEYLFCDAILHRNHLVFVSLVLNKNIFNRKVRK